MAAVTVENVDAVAVWVVALRSLRDQLDIQRCEDLIDIIPDRMHIFKLLRLELADVDFDLKRLLLQVPLLLHLDALARVNHP